MKKKLKTWVAPIAALLAIGIAATTLLSCDNGSGGGGSGGGGGGSPSTLTVNNCPAGANVLICTDATISNQAALVSAASSYVATSMATSSPFNLVKIDSSAWTGSGTYLVIITVAADAVNSNAFKTGVSFTNGSATIDYNSMTKQKNLPV